MYFGESSYVNEYFMIKNYLTSEVIKNLKPEDLNDKQKMKEVIYKIQKEQDQKEKEVAILFLVKLFLHLILMTYSVGLSSIIMLVESIIGLVKTSKLSTTKTGLMIDRANETLDKLKSNGADPKKIKACEKLIKELKAIDQEQRKQKKA